MEDRFKFRAWRKGGKSMVLPGEEVEEDMLMVSSMGEVHELHDNWQGGEYLSENHTSYILMACTGLKDKNGKLIFEGDIIKHDDGDKGAVRFNELIGAFEVPLIGYGDSLLLYMWHKGEVIGNIYENPELLNQD